MNENPFSFVTDRQCLVVAIAVLMMLLAGAVRAADAQASDNDGPIYQVTGFSVSYLRENPGLPATESYLAMPVTLGLTETGFVAPREGVEVETLPLGDLKWDRPRPFYASAIQQIIEQVRDSLVAKDLLGIYVAPNPSQIDSTGQDLRPDGQMELNLFVAVGMISEIRSLAHGERIDPEERLNHPLHQRLIEQSPVQPTVEGEPTGLIEKTKVDDYALMLSRHPGRRVDVAVAPAPEPGTVVLDYLITETKPWLVYAKISNTGTESTSKLREQFGFRHYQLTNNDDIFGVDYLTSNFDASHAVMAFYDTRLFDSNKLRGRVYGGWSQYTASDVGITGDTFEGESWHAGGELSCNVFQDGHWFVDLGAGVWYEDIEVSNTVPGSMDGRESFLLPYAFGRMQHVTQLHALYGQVKVEWQDQGFSGADSDDIQNLGRPLVDEDWVMLQWDLSHSFFVEPLINPDPWRDPNTPETSTLAHELYFNFRGQHVLDEHRVVPQHEAVVGGLYTVRGYEQAIVAGDTALIATAEYRYHVPRAFRLEPEPRQFMGQTFRFSPQQVYGPVDWDFILKGFVDAAHVIENEAVGIPRDTHTLVGTGIGFEVQYRRNITFRLDWGVALTDVPGRAEAGDNEIHFELTLLY